MKKSREYWRKIAYLAREKQDPDDFVRWLGLGPRTLEAVDSLATIENCPLDPDRIAQALAISKYNREILGAHPPLDPTP